MQTLLLSSDMKPGICHRMTSLRMLYITTLTYTFKIMNFEMLISRKRWELAKVLKYDFYRGWYLPSNGNIANDVFHDLHQNFQGQTFQVAVWQINTGKCKYYYCHQIGSQVFAIEWRHCKCCTVWPWPTLSSSNISNLNISETMS